VFARIQESVWCLSPLNPSPDIRITGKAPLDPAGLPRWSDHPEQMGATMQYLSHKGLLRREP